MRIFDLWVKEIPAGCSKVVKTYKHHIFASCSISPKLCMAVEDVVTILKSDNYFRSYMVQNDDFRPLIKNNPARAAESW